MMQDVRENLIQGQLLLSYDAMITNFANKYTGFTCD